MEGNITYRISKEGTVVKGLRLLQLHSLITDLERGDSKKAN